MVKTPSLRNARVVTRGSQLAQVRDKEVINLFRKHGAKLVDAHGTLVGENQKTFEVVPPNTVVIFLSEVGYCSSIQTMRQLENNYFRSKIAIERFIQGDAARQGVHYGNAYNRTYLPGEKYPSLSLYFMDENFAGMGYVWKLPLRRERMEINAYMELGPNSSEVYNGISRTKYILLKEVMERLGSGVYIVASCIVPYDQRKEQRYPRGKLPMNLPRNMGRPNYYTPNIGWKRVAPIRTKNTIRVGIHRASAISKPVRLRPSVPRTGVTPRPTPYMRKIKETRKSRIYLNQALTRMSRTPSRVKMGSIIPYMNANINKEKLKKTLFYLKHPKTFIEEYKNKPNMVPAFNKIPELHKGRYIYNRL